MFRLASGDVVGWTAGIRHISIDYTTTEGVPADLELAAREASAFMLKQSGLTHGVIWREDTGGGVFIRDTKPQAVYQTLYARFGVPMIQSWASWLAAKLKQRGWLTRLKCHGMDAAVYHAGEKNLERLIQEAVLSGEIQF